MPRSASDLKDIPTSEFDRLRPEQLIELVALGRVTDNGSDKQRARTAWEALVLGEFDRVRQLVKAFEFPGKPGVRIPRDQVDDAVQESFMRLFKMLANFAGSSVGEFHGALRTCVQHTCMDYCRKEMRIDKGLAGSLDETVDSEDGSERGRFDHATGKQEREQLDARDAASDYVDRIAEALESIDSEDMQTVLAMTWEGASVAQIADELDTSADNVYQLRCRGMKKLDAALSQPAPESGADSDNPTGGRDTDGNG